MRFWEEDPASVAVVVGTGAGPSGVSEHILPSGWLAHAWRTPTRTQNVDRSGQALKTSLGSPSLNKYKKKKRISRLLL